MTTGSRSHDASKISTLEESSIVEIERAVRDTDLCAFAVAPRVVRRAIRDQVDLPGLSTRVPHRKSSVISGTRARHIVMNDELGIDADATLPETVLLLARPEEHELEGMTEGALREHYRRLHFHARIHVALAPTRSGREIDDRTIRNRIDRIGSAAFEEIRTVLRQESFLLPSADDAAVYTEFVAVFLELRYFEPDLLPVYFPSLDDVGRIEAVVAQDVDAHAILMMSVDLTAGTESPGVETTGGFDTSGAGAPPRHSLAGRALSRARRDASVAATKGNDVRAAILHTRIASASDRGFARAAAALANEDIERLVRRLQHALELEGEAIETWRELLTTLLPQSAVGFWNAAARLLYDIQKVCLDFERITYIVDLGAWLRSFGRRPLKRELPVQREVRMSKHLRSATTRLAKVRLPDSQREQFAILLQDASAVAEDTLRARLRPTIEGTILEVGFRPQNVPERVSFRKIVEELLDAVVMRGFFAMGDMRDAIARNNLKLDDVADLRELFVGDRLLRADRRLADVLDGVYIRGAFYLRWLQRLSSCAFGTRTGRLFTLYAAIPFGGAFLLLAGLDHLIHAVERVAHGSFSTDAAGIAIADPAHEAQVSQPNLATAPAVLLVGLFLMAVIHHDGFRGIVWRGARLVGRSVRGLVVEFPRWLAEVTLIHRILQSAPVVFFRKRLLTSLLFTLFVSGVLPLLGWYKPPTKTVTALLFVVTAVVLNSRAGRDIEELATERLQRIWHRIRVHVFVALFDLVMDSFKRVLEWLERILYEVDEWLRFQSGQTTLMLAVKAVLGLIWAIVRFFLRFIVAVLIEPQINPIKHFPVVTVSHKVILPLYLPLERSLVPVFGVVRANMIATTTVFLMPGVFGFLVWELRANWRLYAVNRYRRLGVVPVGRHGETMIRLMKPGIHSGTLPRLFARLRRAARRTHPSRRILDLVSFYAKLRRVETDARRFFEREFLNFLTESRAFRGVNASIGVIELGTNSMRVEVAAPSLGDDSLSITFEHQSGRLIAGIWRTGWIANLSEEQRAALAGLLVGLYRICGVDLVREQIVSQLEPHALEYEVAETGLLIEPETDREPPGAFGRDEFPVALPWNDETVSLSPGLPNADALIFRRTATLWIDWTSAWSQEETAEPFPDLPPLHPMAVALPAEFNNAESKTLD